SFGRPLRFVSAIFFNSVSDMESYISRDAPLSSDFFLSPRLAARAAPAAFCWSLDLAGISILAFGCPAPRGEHGSAPLVSRLSELHIDQTCCRVDPYFVQGR